MFEKKLKAFTIQTHGQKDSQSVVYFDFQGGHLEIAIYLLRF